MKKLMLALLAIAAFVAFDADAWYRRGGKCCATESTGYRCNERVEEEPCGKPPCCVKYKKVTEPAQRVKHVSYTWECPDDCDIEKSVTSMRTEME